MIFLHLVCSLKKTCLTHSTESSIYVIIDEVTARSQVELKFKAIAGMARRIPM